MTTLTLKEWLEDQINGDNAIRGAIAEWVLDSFEYEGDRFTIKNVAEHLERIDCAGCNAPAGLIYNHDIAAKIPLWHAEIDETLYDYQEATGEQPKPRDGALTLGWLVWFAVEWVANDMARLIEGNAEDGTITENPATPIEEE